jgi:prepilin peptidase CpaA
MTILGAASVIFPLCVAYAAFSDLFTMTIPNRVSLMLIAAFVLMATLSGFGPMEFAWHVAAMTAVFAGCLGLFAAGAMGGGDAKLLTAVSLWFGMSVELMSFLVYTALIGGLLALVLLKLRTPAGLYVLSRVPLTHNLTDSSKGIPYGIAIAAAALICYPQTPMMQQALAAMAAG